MRYVITHVPIDCESIDIVIYLILTVNVGHAVAQLVETLRYKSEGRGFDCRCCHWNYLLT